MSAGRHGVLRAVDLRRFDALRVVYLVIGQVGGCWRVKYVYGRFYRLCVVGFAMGWGVVLPL